MHIGIINYVGHVMRRFFIDQPVSVGATQYIEGSDSKHIRNVLRLKPGRNIELSDGKGSVYSAKIEELHPNKVKVAIQAKLPSVSESNIEISVAQALLKGKKMDTLARGLTELGVSAWLPFVADRSVPKVDSRNIEKRMARWEKIARESLKQCGRERIPEIGFAESFEDVINAGKNRDLKLAFWEGETKSMDHLADRHFNEKFDGIFVLFGPEGGFTAEEMELARNSGFVTASLGPRILRAETAVIAGCAILQYLFGDMKNMK